ncbi:MAG: hybrid sensor histidine kinase/response regulator [Verrucomicrobiia bacterium]
MKWGEERRKGKATVLIVDDVPENLQVLAGHLVGGGHEVISATSGPRAFEILARRSVDLILLDIMMPGMDGFEVIRGLKANPKTEEIPVMFITARSDSEDVVAGLQLGAVDYITKPFRLLELLARVRTHLELKQMRDGLKRANDEKNRFIGMVSHDMRGFCGNVIAVSQLVRSAPGPEQVPWLEGLGIEAEHMLTLAENLLNADALEAGQIRLESEPVEVGEACGFARQALEISARAKQIEVKMEMPSGRVVVRADRIGLRQILTNYLSNAVKYSREGGTIRMLVRREEGKVVIEVVDEGPGLSPEAQGNLFQPYRRGEVKARGQEHSAGLGLSLVRSLAEAMGGRVGCRSEVGKGSTFFVELPGVE